MRRPASIAIAVLALGTCLLAQSGTVRPSGTLVSGEWTHYGGNAASHKYSPLDQINKDNIGKLTVAWRWASPDNAVVEANPTARPGGYADTPLMVKGVLYTVTSLGQIAAINPGTGQSIWSVDPGNWKTGRPGNLGYVHRGLAYWTDGKIDRLLLGTHDAYLISIDARTGKLDAAFGEGGRIDLMGSLAHAVRATNYSVSAAPVICKDVVVVGASIHDGPTHKEWPRGDVSGFDVRTGKKLWTIHSIPQKGEFGNETWGDDSWTYTGSTNVWTNMSSDEELGLVYLPFGTPTDDFYGGHRPGANLFAETLLAVDVKTGKRVWHFQGVHHGIWDYDFPAAPILVDINVNGKPVKAVAQVSKQGFTYVLDRRTGAPVWPIEERPVPQSTVPGERTSATQPFPTRPPAYERQGVTARDLIDFTPELKAAALGEGDNRQSGMGRRRELGRRLFRSGNGHVVCAVDDEPDRGAAREAEPRTQQPALCARRDADAADARWAAAAQAAIRPHHRARSQQGRPEVADRGRRRSAQSSAAERPEPARARGPDQECGDGHQDAAVRRDGRRQSGRRQELAGWRPAAQ